MALIDRGEYWQCALRHPQRRASRRCGPRTRRVQAQVAAIAPYLADRVGELDAAGTTSSCSRCKVDRLRRWYRAGPALHRRRGARHVADRRRRHQPRDPGRGGRRQHAPPRRCCAGRLRIRDLRGVQRRREFAAKTTQALQLLVQQHVIGRVLANDRSRVLDYLPAVARRMPFLSRIPGRLVALGLRREHVRTPAAPQ